VAAGHIRAEKFSERDEAMGYHFGVRDERSGK
jgi:hypothetical protein